MQQPACISVSDQWPRRAGRARYAKGRATLGAWILALAAVVFPTQRADADIRQHILGATAPDVEAMLTELTAAMRGEGFQVTPMRDETRTVPASDTSITYRHVEYQCYHNVDGRSISVSFFLLVEPDREDFEPLKSYVMTNFGYSFTGGGALRVRGVGFLAWAEWSSSGAMTTETLNKELADWREAYIEVD